MSEFDKLLASLQDSVAQTEELAKALPKDGDADDKSIAAAAEDKEDTDADPDADPADGEPEEDDGKKAPLAKSLTTIDGEEFEAVDATEILKALEDRVGEHSSVLAKALETTVAALNSQNLMIKALGAKVEALSNEGRGRKTVLTINEKRTTVDTLAKSETPQVTGDQILAKALSAQTAGKITGLDVSRAEVALQNGVAVPADIMARLN